MTMTFKLKFSAMTCVAAAIVALAPVGAYAADLDSLAHARVSYADLNLMSDAGVATLYSRLAQAADAVCQRDSRDLALHSAYQTCVRQAMGSAVTDVASLKLSTLYTQKTGVRVDVKFASNVN